MTDPRNLSPEEIQDGLDWLEDLAETFVDPRRDRDVDSSQAALALARFAAAMLEEGPVMYRLFVLRKDEYSDDKALREFMVCETNQYQQVRTICDAWSTMEPPVRYREQVFYAAPTPEEDNGQ